MQRTMVMGGIVLVAIVAMLFTLPDMIGLEFTIAMSMTLAVLMGIYVVLVTEIIHRTALAMIGSLIIIIILIYTGLIPAHDSVDFVIVNSNPIISGNVKSIAIMATSAIPPMTIVRCINLDLNEPFMYQYTAIFN